MKKITKQKVIKKYFLYYIEYYNQIILDIKWLSFIFSKNSAVK